MMLYQKMGLPHEPVNVATPFMQLSECNHLISSSSSLNQKLRQFPVCFPKLQILSRFLFRFSGSDGCCQSIPEAVLHSFWMYLKDHVLRIW